MTRYARNNPERDRAIVADRRAGAFYKVIAAKHDLTDERVRQICIAAGLTRRRRSRSKKQ
jgi:hypothetical protein